MKRVLLLGILASLISLTNAQVIPNAGFENWDTMYENPLGYSTSNTYVYQYSGIPNVTKQDTAYSGNHSVKIVTSDLQGFPFLGFVMYGDPSALLGGGSIMNIKGGFPFNQRPTDFVFHARYQCTHSDTAYVVVILKKSGIPIPISYTAYKLIGKQDTYKTYSFPLTYFVPIFNPDSAIIAFASSNPLFQDSMTIGNWLEVDKISFTGATAAIPNNDFENWEIAAEPQDWITTNTFDLLAGRSLGIVPVSPGHTGNVAAKITSNVLNIGNPIPDTIGIIALGDKNSTNNNPGMGLVNNPDSLSFWYKYNNSKNTKDSAYSVIMFSKYNTTTSQSDQLDSNGFALGAASVFTHKTLKFPYIYGKSADTIAIIFSSSKFTPTGRGVGNYLIVDDVVLWSHHVGIPVSSHDQSNNFVYPNPAKDYVNVQFELNTPANVTISLVDLNGRNIKSQDFSLSEGKQLVKLDLQEVTDGQYLVVIGQGSNSIYSKRIVIRR